MAAIPGQVREALKRPLGVLLGDIGAVREAAGGRRIISVGDVCTLGLLERGITPHLAVFDHLFMRRELTPGMKRALDSQFRNPARYRNPPGTLSDELLRDAPALIGKGGAVLIDGEEDLTALAFILAAGPGEIVVYGQPNEGVVLVGHDEKLKSKIRGWLSAAALGHEVEGHVRE